MFLTADQLRALTGYKQARRQIAWLSDNGVPFVVAADGKPRVAVKAIKARLGAPLDPAPSTDAEALIADNPYLWVRQHFLYYMLDQEEIVQRATPFNLDGLPPAGIYFWIEQGEIVYVGKSVDMAYRHLQHKKKHGRYPEAIYVLEGVPDNAMELLEAVYIHWFRPEINTLYPYVSMYALSDFLDSRDVDWRSQVCAGYDTSDNFLTLLAPNGGVVTVDKFRRRQCS